MADYVLEGPKWGGSGLGTAGGVVTWEIDPTISLNMLALIVTAFADWASWANIQFQQVAASVDADIAFTVGAIDGLDNVLGTTQYWYSGSSFVSADIEFDSGEGWYNSGSSVVSSDGLDFFMVALHEIGHAIGMDHYNTTPAVMNAFLNTSIHDLQASDIHGIQAIYGTPVTYAAGASGDFSGEGAYDVLWQNYVTNDVGFWTLADNTPRWTDIGIASSTVNMVGTGDVNGDGTSDILWQNPTNGYVGAWMMYNGAATWRQIDQGSTTMKIADIGDFNGDGKSDVLWQNPTNNFVGFWAMNGASDTFQLIDQGSLTMKIAGVGDFNGDGTSDILWQNPTNGIVGYWAMNNGRDSWHQLDTGPSGFKIAGTGDYNGDGTSDILWKNPVNGDTGVWTLNNGINTWHQLGTQPSGFDLIA